MSWNLKALKRDLKGALYHKNKNDTREAKEDRTAGDGAILMPRRGKHWFCGNSWREGLN